MSKSQKEIVVETVQSFYGKDFKNGMKHSTDNKKKIVDQLIEKFEKGELTIKSEQENLRNYMVGLLNNHIRKAKELNGDVKYEAANPGSRAGQSNPAIKATRQLYKKFKEEKGEDDASTIKVKSTLDKMVAEHKAKSKPEAEINEDDLPEELRGMVG